MQLTVVSWEVSFGGNMQGGWWRGIKKTKKGKKKKANDWTTPR